MKDSQIIPPNIIAEMEALAGRPVDFSDIAEVTDASGFRHLDFSQLPPARNVPVDSDLLDWFRKHGQSGEDVRARINRALREHVAKAGREPA